MILFLLSLLAGIVTVLAPCTISLLPIIVGGSMGGERSFKRALVVTGSLGASVIIFTLALKVSTALITIPQEFWQILSGVIIIALGIVAMFPSLYEHLPWVGSMNRSSNRLLAMGYKKKSFRGDILMGAALGPVFSSCSPTYFLILATVLPRSFIAGVIYLLAYTVGLCGGLLVVTLAGQKLLQKFGVASDPYGWFKRSIGVLFLLVGVAILFGYDKKLELAVASNIFDVTKIEQILLATQKQKQLATQTPSATTTISSSTDAVVPADTKIRIASKAATYQKVPEITNPSGFVNTNGKPIKIADFVGKKVILVDFWTYSCINCQRTLPYVKSWYDKYHDQGLEIISIHTPEFAFEHVLSNVQKYVTNNGIPYPVVLDNVYGTWNAFGNQYWPRKYLIDIDGFIVYDHAGEGDYAVTEKAIQNALMERAAVLGTPVSVSGSAATKGVLLIDSSKIGSPEIYFGSSRSNKADAVKLGGSWNLTSEFAENTGEASITYAYDAKNVYFVGGSRNGVVVDIYKDGILLKTIMVQAERLYTLIEGDSYGEHTLQMKIKGSGLQAFTFTFG